MGRLAAREMEKLANEVETGSQDFTKDIIAPDPKKPPKAPKEKKTKSTAELAAELRKKLSRPTSPPSSIRPISTT
ncbi:hypothetical protein [Paenibacillus sp. FSL M7-0420]|uniref:hypothetical protein n=1 Tax=Paenibacillus sp. FSL M7-0420 TaxID=2921609 RepID=UPI0030FB1C22